MHAQDSSDTVDLPTRRQAPEADKLHIYRVVLKIENGVSGTESVELSSIDLPPGSVEDMKLVDDTSLILAITENSSSRLLAIPYSKRSASLPRPSYRATGEKNDIRNDVESHLDLTEADQLHQFTRHTFPAGNLWTPEKLEVNGRKGRRVVCVLAKDRLHYRVFDVDSGVDGGHLDGVQAIEGRGAAGDIEDDMIS